MTLLEFREWVEGSLAWWAPFALAAAVFAAFALLEERKRVGRWIGQAAFALVVSAALLAAWVWPKRWRR